MPRRIEPCIHLILLFVGTSGGSLSCARAVYPFDAIDEREPIDAVPDTVDIVPIDSDPADVACRPEETQCGGRCYVQDLLHCGQSCRICPMPSGANSHGVAVCTTSGCRIDCDPGYVSSGPRCIPRSRRDL